MVPICVAGFLFGANVWDRRLSPIRGQPFGQRPEPACFFIHDHAKANNSVKQVPYESSLIVRGLWINPHSKFALCAGHILKNQSEKYTCLEYSIYPLSLFLNVFHFVDLL